MPTLSNEQRVAIAVGIPVAAILLYLLFRRLRRDEFDDEEDDVEDETIDEVEEVASTSESTIEVRVPRSAVGVVIGKGGVNIKRIQKESGARLNFKDDEDEESPERTAIVRGEREKAKKAELLIKKVIAQQPVVTTEEVYVPVEACGRIIGRGGQSIRQICRISGAKVTVERSSELDSQSPLRKVTLTGTAEQILHGKCLLEEKVTEEASFAAQKGATRNSSGRGYQQEKVVPVIVQDTVTKFPDGSDYVRVFVSALEDPTSFHVQLITENADSLEAMNAELTAEFFNSADTSVMNGFKTGDLCCAPFDVDNCWYRARITNISNDNTVDVLYVDFGDKGQVHKSRLRVLKNRYRALPHQAVHCSLANYRPKDDEWSDEAIEAFEEITYCAQWQVVMARVMRYCGDIPCVELVDTNSPSQDVNIGEELEKKQFAVYESAYPSEAVLKERCIKNQELNHRLTDGAGQKGEVPRDERNESEHKRSLSFQEYDLKAAKKPRADDASVATETNKSSTEPGVDNKIPADEKASVESVKNRKDELTLNGNTAQLPTTSETSNIITEEKLCSESASNQNTELLPDQSVLQTQTSNSVLNSEDKPISQVVENPVTELMPNGFVANTAKQGDSRTEKDQMTQTPDQRRSSDRIDAADVVDRGSKRDEEISPFHEPISPNNESSRLHYAKIKRNLSISTEDGACKGDSTVSEQLESLLEEKVQLGMESTVDTEPRKSALLGVVSSDQSVDSDFLGKEVPNLKNVIVDNQNVDIPKKEKEGIEVSEKQARIKSTSSVFTSSAHPAVSSQKTYVSSVSVVTKKKANDVFVRLSSSAGEQVEAEGMGERVIKTPSSNSMTTTEAKRASTELVVNVSSSSPVGSVPVGETLTSNSDEMIDTANTGNHDNGLVSNSAIRSEPNGYSSQTVTLTTKRVTQLKTVTMVATTNADGDADGFVTPSSSFTVSGESADDSDSESFLSAREEVTSDTDTAAYLTAQASGSTTSLDYQSDTDTAHTPVNSDSEDERGGPTTPKPSFIKLDSDNEDAENLPTDSLSSKEIAERVGLFKSVSETELGYRADTESLTSREDLRQAGSS